MRREPGSFRDPSGFIFERDGQLYRQINECYVETWRGVVKSGLYESLVTGGFAVAVKSAALSLKVNADAAEVIEAERLPFISYPYEWSFSRLRDAALLTINIQRKAMEFGFSLKDATAYNIQFKSGQPVHIDSLSFDRRIEGEPWIAYAQFCRHFLAPLSLQSHVSELFGLMLQSNLDGYPLPYTRLDSSSANETQRWTTGPYPYACPGQPWYKQKGGFCDGQDQHQRNAWNA